MKTHFKQYRKWLTIFTMSILLVLTIMVSCSKNDDVSIGAVSNNDAKLFGEFELLDLMIVNSQNGSPQKEGNLIILGNELVLKDNDSFISVTEMNEDVQQGIWQSKNDKLILMFENGMEFNFKILEIKDDAIELEQEFEAKENYSSGNIYYTFIKE
ncbi:hypothetical protein QSE00_14020 [Arenibacter sp. M-2]|uniref:hypothetical protein n=1 Tax=Arenibacter sp. M-2 TaxID=3053612 RepID=UPI00256FA7FC|nr:hypothetical protein [Arenibacter sp. M-2]MDL5512939.1 hypothetical protein [Arenibacter sp. M-2]